jgi:SAM-dependent methyltransferase
LDEVRERVRARYASAATAVIDGGVATCGDTCKAPGETGTGAELYTDAEQDQVPGAAIAASLGCGNPVAVADLREGETVLDLGSGGGIDVLLSARRVGPAGKAYGLDMTGEMLDLAQANAAEAGAVNVEFLQGHMEAIPLPDASVDVIISREGMSRAGFTAVHINPTHQVTDGLHSAIIQAVKPRSTAAV